MEMGRKLLKTGKGGECTSLGGTEQTAPSPGRREGQSAEGEPAEGPLPCELRSGGLGHMPPQPPPYLNIPVLIQVIDAGDAAPVAVGIVNMPHVPEPTAWVTRHHGLVGMEEGGLLRPGRDALRKQANHSCPKSVLYHLRLWVFQPERSFS